jgi:hypothetical protein
MEMSAPAERASMKALVPDLAMVPKLLTKSALVMPIPLKITEYSLIIAQIRKT